MLEKAEALLKKYYGYQSFRPGQEKIIANIMGGNDTLAIMPTGGGKSICFQIPALLFEGTTLVISPLISLMKDQVDTLTGLGIPAAFINSTLSLEEVRERFYKAQKGEYKLLYIAPERLESEYFYELLNSLKISFIAVDEAHCVSQWGHDFRPSYRKVGELIKKINKQFVIAGFTATATEEVREDIISLLHLKNPKTFVTGFDRENLFFSVIKDENKKDFVEKYIRANKDKSGIIYAATRKEVDGLYEMLRKRGLSVGRYHAGLSDEERASSQEAFLYDDIQVMAATNAFGMGIDKSNVRYVLHYNMPKNIEAYYQEAGRAGRDGEPSECILLFGPQDTVLQKFLIEQTTFSPERKANEFKKLQSMVDYCHTTRCLRKYILEYFGENDVPEECGNCSSCKSDAELSDVTIEAQKIFSCILRMREKFGTSLVADVLKGSKNKRILELKFDGLSTYGIMQEYSVKEIKDLINMFVAEEYLYLSGTQYPVVKLREKAGLVLKGTEKVFQRVAKREEKVEADGSLFEVLRLKRRSIAEVEKVPPYIIFSDSTLKEMSIYCPIDEKSMLSIKGVGEMKLQKYGAEFLNTIRQYFKDSGREIPGNSSEESAMGTVNTKKDEMPSHVISLQMYKDGKNIDEISKERDLNKTTIQDHLIRCYTEGMDVNLSHFIPEKYRDLILQKIKEIGCEKLRPLKDALPDEVDYMAIKASASIFLSSTTKAQ
jgi:ATP-dependent DNA helicase RecQ